MPANHCQQRKSAFIMSWQSDIWAEPNPLCWQPPQRLAGLISSQLWPGHQEEKQEAHQGHGAELSLPDLPLQLE